MYICLMHDFLIKHELQLINFQRRIRIFLHWKIKFQELWINIKLEYFDKVKTNTICSASKNNVLIMNSLSFLIKPKYYNI